MALFVVDIIETPTLAWLRLLNSGGVYKKFTTDGLSSTIPVLAWHPGKNHFGNKLAIENDVVQSRALL